VTSDLLFKYLLIMELHVDGMLLSILGDEKSDAGHIKCPRGQQVPHLGFTCYCCSSFLMSFASFLDDIQAHNCIYAKILQLGLMISVVQLKFCRKAQNFFSLLIFLNSLFSPSSQNTQKTSSESTELQDIYALRFFTVINNIYSDQDETACDIARHKDLTCQQTAYPMHV